MHDASFENIIMDGALKSNPTPNVPGMRLRWVPNPDFESQVAAILGVLRKTWTGWAVLRAVYDCRKNKQQQGQEVRIVPFTPIERLNAGGAKAVTTANNQAASRDPYGHGYVGGFDDRRTPRDDRYDRVGYQGTGVGSGCEIHFEPRGSDADTTLLHELVHAVRIMSGVIDRVPTEFALRAYDDTEEFYPNVVTNIYLSEKGEDDQMEFGHGDFGRSMSLDEFINNPSLPPMLDGRFPLTPAGLLNHPDLGKPVRRLLFRMTSDNEAMCNNIAQKVRVTAKWNLLREYLENPAKYPMY
jgi:hypothetical protein